MTPKFQYLRSYNHFKIRYFFSLKKKLNSKHIENPKMSVFKKKLVFVPPDGFLGPPIFLRFSKIRNGFKSMI